MKETPHPSIYANTQPASRFIPAQRVRKSVWKWQQRREWTHWRRDYKIIFPPPQMSCGTDNCFLLRLLHNKFSYKLFPKTDKNPPNTSWEDQKSWGIISKSHSILQNNSGFVNLNCGISIFNTQRVFVLCPLMMGKGSVLSHSVLSHCWAVVVARRSTQQKWSIKNHYHLSGLPQVPGMPQCLSQGSRQNILQLKAHPAHQMGGQEFGLAPLFRRVGLGFCDVFKNYFVLLKAGIL